MLPYKTGHRRRLSLQYTSSVNYVDAFLAGQQPFYRLATFPIAGESPQGKGKYKSRLSGAKKFVLVKRLYLLS